MAGNIDPVEDSKNMVVLYTPPWMGHLVSIVELGKLLIAQGLSVTILTVEKTGNTGVNAGFVESVTAANPGISFHQLPTVTLPQTASIHDEIIHTFDLLRLSNPNLLSFLRSVSPLALFIDFFCTIALDVTAELGLPCYYFFTASASNVAFLLHFPVIHAAATTRSFRDLGSTPLEFPGLPPIPADHFPDPQLDLDDEGYKGFLYIANSFPDSDGIMVNTFEELEPRAFEAITAGLCVPPRRPTPPIYCIGPLIALEGRKMSNQECIRWLDKQPRASVVFLCFGSLGRFSVKQLTEIAAGLERSGQRFLWSLRSPPSDDPAKMWGEPDLDALLPSGFLERMKDKGLVLKSWAPQLEVLNHESIGAFVTHCGWNSVLEAVTAGVPMIGWPLYAEQRLNRTYLEKELRLVMPLDGYEREMVVAEEIERKIRWVMDSEGGRELRKRSAEAKGKAVEARREEGSSHAALVKLVQALKR